MREITLDASKTQLLCLCTPTKQKNHQAMLAFWVKVSRLVIPYPVLDRFWPCLGQRKVKLYTLLRTARPKNHILFSSTSPYSRNKGVPPPQGGRQHVSPELSSVYYHVNLYCVTAAFPGFQPSPCQEPSDLMPFLLPEHKATAITRFGVAF